MSRAIYMADVEQIYCYSVLGVSLIYSIHIYIISSKIKYMFNFDPWNVIFVKNPIMIHRFISKLYEKK